MTKTIHISIILFILLHIYGCRKNTSTETAPCNYPETTLFSSASPLNTPIPANPEIDPNSDKMVKSLVKDSEDKGFFIALKSFSETVYLQGLPLPVMMLY